MATDRYNVCSARTCGYREWADSLFYALRNIQQGKTRCSKCGAKSHLELEFSFGNGQYPHLCRVLDAFLPEKPTSWPEGRYIRGFYPFLVVVESMEEEGIKLKNRYRSAWLPYWHVDEDRHGEIVKVKYGQWAPFMEQAAFASLLNQARAKGYEV